MTFIKKYWISMFVILVLIIILISYQNKNEKLIPDSCVNRTFTELNVYASEVDDIVNRFIISNNSNNFTSKNMTSLIGIIQGCFFDCSGEKFRVLMLKK